MADWGILLEKINGITIVYLPRWIMFGGYGLTLYKLILVRRDSKDLNYVIEHEKVHVEQWTNIGFFKFPYLYLKELYKVGYWDNKYEVEARNKGSIRSR